MGWSNQLGGRDRSEGWEGRSGESEKWEGEKWEDEKWEGKSGSEVAGGKVLMVSS